MIDSGAMLKGFQKEFNITPKEFKDHLSMLTHYRLYVETSNKIVQIRKRGGSRVEILGLRLKLKEDLREL